MGRKKQNYESMMERLEVIVNNMENNELSLDDAIKNYEEGIKISNNLYKVLNDAEGKIKILTQDGEKDFNIEE
jgi:exodeoxyribonuclease VII small subunit